MDRVGEGQGVLMATKTEPKMMSCARCGKQIEEDKALYRGSPAKNMNENYGGKWNWRNFAHCEDCDYEDYSNSPGGM